MRQILVEIGYFISPLVKATKNEESFELFFKNFGYEFDVDGLTAAYNAIESGDVDLEEVWNDLINFNKDDLVEVGRIAAAAFNSVKSIMSSNILTNIYGDFGAFFVEVFDFLCFNYLSFRFPVIEATLEGLGVITKEEVEPATSGRDIRYTKINCEWTRLGQFIHENETWASEVYSWNSTDFKYNKAIDSSIKIVEAIRLGLASKRDLSSDEVTTFLKNVPGDAELHSATLPFLQNEFQSVDNTGIPDFKNEAGLKILPYGDMSNGSKFGLAVAPFAKGAADGAKKISDEFSIEYKADFEATGVAAVTMTPQGLGIESDTAVSGSFEVGMTYEDKDKKPIYLIGDKDGTHIRVQKILASIGGDLTGDFFVAGGFDGFAAQIDLGEDGFLGNLVPEPISIDVGKVIMGWRTGRGVYFEGGTSLAVTVPLDLNLGPLKVYDISLELDWDDGVSLTSMVTADAQVGPLYAYVENLGLEASLVPNAAGTGTFGKYDLKFEFRKPSGYAISLDGGAVTGGGMLSVNGDEYRGALALNFSEFGFSAYAILNTRMPNGKKGFSFAASIFGQFNLPLGYGFFLTGLGGFIGINRTVNTDALRDVLYEGRMDNLLFPSDPIANAKTILDDMAAILPVKEDQHLFGPVAKISWGQPSLIDIKLGLIIEVGKNTKILILGGLDCSIPTKKAALVVLKLSFIGEIDTGKGTISFDATLKGSRILSWPVSGEMALRTGWAKRLDHVASFGGLHPQYPRPSNLPDLKRLSINFGTNNPKLTLSAYQAITSNSLQFGARADLYAKGPKIWPFGRFAAEGWVYFDALIYFNPFAFDIQLGGGISLLKNGSVICGLGFKLRLRGPNTFKINGKVWVTVLGIDIKFGVNHTWGDSRNLPVAKVNALEVLREAIQDSKGFEVIAPKTRKTAVTFREETESRVDPLGGLRFVQKAVPLNIKIEKVGNAEVGEVKKVDIEVKDKNNKTANIKTVKTDFIRGHYYKLSEAERLRAPAFESHKAGFEFSAEELVITKNTKKIIEGEMEHEILPIEIEEDDKPSVILPHKLLTGRYHDRFRHISNDRFRRPEDILKEKAGKAPVINESRFIAHADLHTVTSSPVNVMRENLSMKASLTEAKLKVDLQSKLETNNTVMDYIAVAGR